MSVILYACPACRAAMPVLNEPDACPVCGRAFAVTLGIPSLGGSEIEPEPQERELIARLVAMYPTATIEEMSAARLAIGATNEDRRTVYNQYHRTLRERGPAFYRMFQERVRQQGWSTAERCVALDIGCGIGGGLLALAQDYERVVGLDISLSSLLIARKVVEQAGLTNVQLVHASAHQLPFAAEMFDFAMAINVLEHVFTPAQMLGEVRRTLKPQGVFTGDSRNRFDLFFKEPHVGLRWVGMLPRRWMETYVRWRIGVDYAATHTYLLSYGDLSRALRATFGTRYCITLPEAAAYGATGAAGAVAEKVNRMKPLRVLTARIAPSHIAVAQRS